MHAKILAVLFAITLLGPIFANAQESKPNIIVIYTDEQRWDTIDYMPILKSRLSEQGVTFTNSFVTTPLCCPSRASFLTGLYTHNHHIWGNQAPLGGATKFNDKSTIATWLQASGYDTALIGKYLNEYHKIRNYIPKGWDYWYAFVNPGYYDYKINDNGLIVKFGSSTTDYSTDVLTDKALEFINNAKRPFFLLFAPYAAHASPTKYPIPAPRHLGTCNALPPHEVPSISEDVSDKPFWMATPNYKIDIDRFRKEQICSLKAVDEAIGAILDTLGSELKNTTVIFTSDNGFLWGEHGQKGKKWVYEESIRVPLILRYDKLANEAVLVDNVALNIDLAPTIAEIAGVSPPSAVDGKSLLTIIKDKSSPWRDNFLVEIRREVASEELMIKSLAVRTLAVKYTEHRDIETREVIAREFYDLSNDPYELNNEINNAKFAEQIKELKRILKQLKKV